MLNRPSTFNEFIGMSKLKTILKIMIASSKKQEKPLDHILLYGSGGLGKTSMAFLISKYSKQKIKYINGNMIEKKSDILSIFANIKHNDIIFIDEIHSINKQVEELLFSAMEDNIVDILVGAEGESKMIRFKLKPFTLIGATTQFGKISEPLLDRFGFSWKFDYYNDNDIKKILIQDAKEMNYTFDDNGLEHLVIFTKNTPRVAKTLIKRIFDFLIIKDQTNITKAIIKKTLNLLQIYKKGLNQHHINYLLLLRDTFNSRPTSLTLAINISKESRDNLENQIEPLLIKNKLIIKNTLGRKITQTGLEYLQSINK